MTRHFELWLRLPWWGSRHTPLTRKKLQWLSDETVPQLEVIMSDGYTGLKGYPPKGTALYGKGFFSLLPVVMQPLSRGTVHINATNLLGKPIIDPNYLSNEYDLQVVIAAIEKCQQIATTPPLSEVLDSEYGPGLNNVNTDDEWKNFVLSPFTIRSEPMLYSRGRQEVLLIRS
jgi:choline dehydrogenase-like flavoprotein